MLSYNGYLIATVKFKNLRFEREPLPSVGFYYKYIFSYFITCNTMIYIRIVFLSRLNRLIYTYYEFKLRRTCV